MFQALEMADPHSTLISTIEPRR